MRTIAEADQGRLNNFNLIRMLAACSVMVSHAWGMVTPRVLPEPLVATTGYSLGILSVIVFFAISGFFITKSFDRRNFLIDFVFARICRIFPGLIVALIATAFIIGPGVTALSIPRYLSAPGTWLYVPQNALLVHLRFELPGVFVNNAAVGVTNASLWTLKYEVGCYVGVVACGFLGLLRPRLFPLVLIAAIAGALIVPGQNNTLPARVAIICCAFAVGAGGYLYRSRIPASLLFAAALLVVALLTRGTIAFPALYALALGYAALSLGFANTPLLRAYNRLGDYSYGVYIYAFPIAQTIAFLMPGIGRLGLISATFPITLLLAVSSWHFIEHPALNRRHILAAIAKASHLRLRARLFN